MGVLRQVWLILGHFMSLGKQGAFHVRVCHPGQKSGWPEEKGVDQ